MRLFYIKVLVILGIFLMPSLVFAETPALPSECPAGEYNFIDVSLDGGEGTNGDDFIFAGSNNATPINGGNGNDCIFIGDYNEANISGVNGNDVIIIGNYNSGQVSGDGENGDDIIKIEDNNSGNVFGGNGADTISIGKNNQGNISGENGEDDITVDCGNSGTVDSPFKKIPCLPTAGVPSGTYTEFQNISLDSVDSETIYYTTDETAPVCFGTSYESAIRIETTTTIKAVGCSVENLTSDITTFTYTINLETDPSGLGDLVGSVFVTTASSSLVTVSQNLKINVPTDSGSNQIILPKDTEITRFDDQPVDASMLTSSVADTNTLSGLAEGQVFEAALQWGIPNVTLQFNPAITISIFVGTDRNGQTLNVVRSVTGTDEWTNEGIVSPTTCVVANGICSFQATKASYYAATGNTSSSSSGGGGSYINNIVMIDGVPVSNNINKENIFEEAIENSETEEAIEPEIVTTPLVPVAISEQELDRTDIRELKGTLLLSDNENRGNLMLVSKNNITYIRTSRDFSSSMGKNVTASVNGASDNFTFLDMAEDYTDENSSEKGNKQPVVKNEQVGKNRSLIAYFFASVGRLIFRSLPLFY